MFFYSHLLHKNTMSIKVSKSLGPILGHFSVHKTEKSKFLCWIHIEYFHLGIFVIPWVCLIRKYGSQNLALFSVFQCFSGYRGYSIAKWFCTSFFVNAITQEAHWGHFFEDLLLLQSIIFSLFFALYWLLTENLE